MRWTTWAAGLAVVVAGAGAVGAGTPRDDDKTFDLRGPAPKKGMVLVSRTVEKMKNADVTLKAMGETRRLKASITSTTEEEVKILAVSGRDVTRYQTRVVKDQTALTADLDGMAEEETITGELEGEVIISARGADGKWTHTLVDTKPTEKQKQQLKRRGGLESDDDLYPAEKVMVGYAWTLEAGDLKRVFGNEMTGAKGQIKQKFLRVEEVNGEPCAVIESVGKVKGKVKDDEGDPTQDADMDLTATSWRSLKTGVEVKGTMKGKMRLAGKQMIGGQDAEMVIEGPLSVESTTKVK